MDQNFIQQLRDNPLYQQLIDTVPTNEGSLLWLADEKTQLAQLSLWETVLKHVNHYMLEVGTNRCFFGYFLARMSPYFHLHTIDRNPLSAKAVDLVCASYSHANITFYEGCSNDVMSQWAMLDVDLAWIDGGHDYKDCYPDFDNAMRLQIPWILGDDYRESQVQDAVRDALLRHPDYVQVENPFYDDDARGIVILKLQPGVRQDDAAAELAVVSIF